MAFRMPIVKVGSHSFFTEKEHQRSIQPVQHRAYGGGGLTGGGIVNQKTGMGTSLDKSGSAFFQPTRIWWRSPLEILCNESWVARNAIDIPIEDMLRRWLMYTGTDEKAIEALELAQEELDVEHVFMQAMKAGDAYGTGVVVMMIDGQMPEEPLDIRRVREGDISALHYFDRYDLSVTHRDYDISSPNWRRPIYYEVHPSYAGAPFRVHHSRVMRFDGIEPSTKSGFYNYDYDFGVSVLVPVITSLMQDESFATSVAHLGQEASIAILHIAGLTRDYRRWW